MTSERGVEHFFDWHSRQQEPERPWLILGKGPSYGHRTRFDLTRYHLLSLNHAVREQRVRLAHMIDLEVVDACGQALFDHARHVILPWYPHVRNAPGSRSLAELVPEHPLLRRLELEGRLLWYDLSTAARRHGPGPVVQATYFSAEAAVDLLARAGVRRVRSLGVDGGQAYSGEFADLHGRTLLVNGQPTFDLQFRGIARTMVRTGLDFAPLDLPAPIVAVASRAGGSTLPDRVLEYSLRRHTSMTVRLHWLVPAPDRGSLWWAMAEREDPDSGIPLRRAILLPPGALVLDDLRKLWARPWDREGVDVTPAEWGGLSVVTAATPQAAVRMVGDASGRSAARARRERLEPGAGSLLVYEAPALRPWLSRAHPLAHLWVAMLIEALEAGHIPLDEIRAQVRDGLVRPSLLEQVERRSPECALVSRAARRLDAEFTPPGGPTPEHPGLLEHPVGLLRALARHARRRAGNYRRRRRSA